jgi:tetraacyldisaccharide 4'-kinase
MADLKTFITDMMKSDETKGGYFPFFFLSILYGISVRLRNSCYEARIIKNRRLGCPVVSIGNITVGGTGKTPMVIMLAETLKQGGFRPAVLSRGYGGRQKEEINIVSDGNNILMGIQEAGDEPLLMAQSLCDVPVITGKKRYRTGRYAIDHLKANILLLDDAFQHRSLERNLDIVLLDAERPFGNGYMLPRGTLRESKNALKRADIIVITGNDGEKKKLEETGKLMRKYTEAPLFYASRRPKSVIDGKTGGKRPLDCLKGKRICAFSGIAKPESFRETLISLGATIVSFIPFPDHHVYLRRDIEEIGRRAAESSAEIVITTEKDGVKLIDFPRFLQDIHLLKITMKTTPSNHEFRELILERLRG